MLAAGVINSPRILELSGVGSGVLLHNLGIDVMVDHPGVGENLQNHVIVTVSAEVKDDLMTVDHLFGRIRLPSLPPLRLTRNNLGRLLLMRPLLRPSFPFLVFGPMKADRTSRSS